MILNTIPNIVLFYVGKYAHKLPESSYEIIDIEKYTQWFHNGKDDQETKKTLNL